MITIKRAAMFGLDARIALAIFGALSVISGAALYSAIQEAKVIATIAEQKEVIKAVESYLLDTGTDIPLHSDPTKALDKFLASSELLSSTVSGWKGPYLPFIDNDATDVYINNSEKIYYIMKVTDANFGGESAGIAPTVCGSPCYYWVGLSKQNTELAKAVDLKIDGGTANTFDSGNVRLFPNATEHNIWIRGPLVLSQP